MENKFHKTIEQAFEQAEAKVQAGDLRFGRVKKLLAEIAGISDPAFGLSLHGKLSPGAAQNPNSQFGRTPPPLIQPDPNRFARTEPVAVVLEKGKGEGEGSGETEDVTPPPPAPARKPTANVMFPPPDLDPENPDLDPANQPPADEPENEAPAEREPEPEPLQQGDTIADAPNEEQPADEQKGSVTVELSSDFYAKAAAMSPQEILNTYGEPGLRTILQAMDVSVPAKATALQTAALLRNQSSQKLSEIKKDEK